jgi:hypothetical protein
MIKRHYQIGELLEIANEKKKTAKRFDAMGFWRFARDDERHAHTIKQIVKRLRK